MAITRANTAKSEPLNNVQSPMTTGAFSATTGNTIIVFVRASPTNPITVTSVTDTAGNTYTQKVSNTTQDPNMFVYVAKNISGNASNVVSVAFTSSNGTYFNWVFAAEYSGLNTTSPDDVFPSNTAAAATDLVSNSFSTAQASELVIIAASQNNFRTYTAGTDFTLIDGSIGNAGLGGRFGGVEEYITAAQLSTYTAHITASASAQYCVVGAALKAATAAARGLFRPPSLDGIGAGGSFFSNPLC